MAEDLDSAGRIREGRKTMTNERMMEEGVILNELAVEEIEEVIAPGFLISE